MLVRRVVTRPATIIRQGSQLQRRFVHPPSSQLRPNTWLAKLRFRPDGKPRSKLIALGFGSLILSNCLSLLVHQFYIKSFEDTKRAVTKIIFLQRTDATYDSFDFDDPISIISYFIKLCQSFSGESEEAVDRAINNMMVHIFMKDAKDDSIKFPLVKALAIMRSAALKIHEAFRELDRDEEHSRVNTARFVILVMERTMGSLLDLAKDNDALASG